MIDSLTRLTMRQYIDMVCGDLSVLSVKKEVANRERLAETRRKLMWEYSRIADEAAAASVIDERVKAGKCAAEIELFRILTVLLGMEEYDSVMKFLSDYGVAAAGFTPGQLEAEVTRLLKRAQTEAKRGDGDKEESKPITAEETRMRFDRQAASLMAYFKFQIDLGTISAASFAALIAQADREIKTKLATYGRK